jgi:hypothetical protein
MSNPVATIGFSVPIPPDPSLTRKTFTRIVYSEQDFFVYGENEYDPTYSGATFNPEGLGERFWMFVPLVDAQAGVPATSPFDMVSNNAWSETLHSSASGFVTAVKSVMPKLLVPSTLLVDNGIYTDGESMFAFTPPGTGTVEAFNWVIDTALGNVVGRSTTELYKYGQVGAYWGSQYVTYKGKDDANAANNETVMKLDNPPIIVPIGTTLAPTGDWIPGDGTELVVKGAFQLMLNVVPLRSGLASVNDAQDNAWTIKIEFGDLIMELNETGALITKYKAAASTEENSFVVNLTQGKAKQGPPQQQHIDDKEPYIITVYPVWNGVVVQDGAQDSRSSVTASSTFVPKQKSPSILEAPYSDGFDPTAPAEVEVGVGTGPTSVVVDFGDSMTVTAKNCRFEIAYLPVFFAPKCWFDEWFIASDDISGTVDFTYAMYPIWTRNGTTAALTPVPAIIQSSIAGPVADTSYYYVKWRLENTAPARFAGEIFGSIIEVEEARDFPIKNGNGNFNLTWIGGTPADPAPTGDWTDYIQSISVNVSIDGSSGQIVVDKYGIAGQDAATIQSIGAITVDALGGAGTVAGRIFSGLALGAGENATTDGATWTIPLVGLEKKLDDIALILAPFLDGFKLDEAIDYLTKYAGLIDNLAAAPNAATIDLQVSEDVNTARYDWKSGTSVRSALDDVKTSVLHEYVVRDGQIFFYELDGLTGFPKFPGPNRAGDYPSTRVMQVDQNPDFEDVRNEIVVIGLEGVPGGQGTNQNIPTFPRVENRKSNTTPDIPWAKSIVQNLPGVNTEAQVSEQADKLRDSLKTYDVLGRVTIPGNADIKPYDTWGNFLIFSVSHNLDFTAKTWTTDLELHAKTT